MEQNKKDNLQQYQFRKNNEDAERAIQVVHENKDLKSEMRKTTQENFKQISSIKKSMEEKLKAQQDEIAYHQKKVKEHQSASKEADKKYVNYEPDILYINQNRFRQNVQQRVNKGDQITKFYNGESPIKTLSLALEQRDTQRNQVVDKNIELEKRRREQYELGVIKRRQEETKKTKNINVNQISEKHGQSQVEKQQDLEAGHSMVTQDRIQSLVERELERERVAKQKQQVRDELIKQMKADQDRKVNQYLLDEKEFKINRKLLQEVAGTEFHRPEEQIKLIN